MTKRHWRGDWLLMRRLGEGGQGEVHLARRIPQNDYETLGEQLATNITHSTVNIGDKQPFIDHLFDAFLTFSESSLGAVKIIHAFDKAKNPKSAKDRFARELDVLKELDHPALITLLDHDKSEGWFVMEYHRHGPLSRHRSKYIGDLLGVLRALRPIIEAVAQLHDQGYIHRDIKPDNIFVADDGCLVLGDFGLVFKHSLDGDRLTEPYENVGSWRWMPPWAQGMRIDEIPPAFDVFTLGKVFWYMLSGKSIFPAHYFRDPAHDLEILLPDDPKMRLANELLHKCLPDDRTEMLQTGSDLLNEIDTLLGTRTLPSNLTMREECEPKSKPGV